MTATKRAKKVQVSARCCWICGRLGGAGFTAALKEMGYAMTPGEMAYAHPTCIARKRRGK